MSVIGSISIKDNVTATLRIIKKEQTSFREDVKKTREEMDKRRLFDAGLGFR